MIRFPYGIADFRRIRAEGRLQWPFSVVDPSGGVEQIAERVEMS